MKCQRLLSDILREHLINGKFCTLYFCLKRRFQNNIEFIYNENTGFTDKLKLLYMSAYMVGSVFVIICKNRNYLYMKMY
jgi:hypothetical protein